MQSMQCQQYFAPPVAILPLAFANFHNTFGTNKNGQRQLLQKVADVWRHPDRDKFSPYGQGKSPRFCICPVVLGHKVNFQGIARELSAK
jgi:hypothetical protein